MLTRNKKLNMTDATDKEEITLSMVFNKLNEYRHELLEKVDTSKTEIFDFVKRENEALSEQLNSLTT